MQDNNQNNQFPDDNWSNDAPPPKKDVKPLLSLIFSIVGLVIGICCCTYAGMGLGIAAVILGIVFMSKHEQKGKGMAIAGIIIGALALIGSIINAILGAALIVGRLL